MEIVLADFTMCYAQECANIKSCHPQDSRRITELAAKQVKELEKLTALLINDHFPSVIADIVRGCLGIEDMANITVGSLLCCYVRTESLTNCACLLAGDRRTRTRGAIEEEVEEEDTEEVPKTDGTVGWNQSINTHTTL
jgi:hypothetical protein